MSQRHTADDIAIQLNRRPGLAGRLQLTRPLVAFDLETTGLSTAKDRIAEFAAVRLQADGSATNLR